MATIQWYPGHMAKAIHQVQDRLSLVDLVLELVDARIPAASRNPEIEKIIQQKPHLIIMTKKDLADPQQTQAWLDYFASQHQPAMAIDSMARTTSKQITAKATEMLAAKLARQAERGIQNRAIRAICVGIPNVGKSTLLNHIINRKIAVTGDRPGVTKNQQWLKTGKGLELLDTPGILWPKFEDQVVGQKLALTGAIKENLFANDDVALLGLSIFKQHYAAKLMQRYHLTESDLEMADPDLLMKMTAKAGMKEDFERFSAAFLLDVRKGRMGRFTADEVPNAATEDSENE